MGMKSCRKVMVVNNLFKLITARKRSFGQGNIFAPVCYSVHGGSASLHAGIHPRDQRQHPPTGVHAGRYGQQVGGMHPTGMQSCLNIITSRNKVVAKVIFLHLFVIMFTVGRGVCLSAWWDTTPPWEQTPPRADTSPRADPPPP